MFTRATRRLSGRHAYMTWKKWTHDMERHGLHDMEDMDDYTTHVHFYTPCARGLPALRLPFEPRGHAQPLPLPEPKGLGPGTQPAHDNVRPRAAAPDRLYAGAVASDTDGARARRRHTRHTKHLWFTKIEEPLRSRRGRFGPRLGHATEAANNVATCAGISRDRGVFGAAPGYVASGRQGDGSRARLGRRPGTDRYRPGADQGATLSGAG